jgi:hypothetical protein
MINEAKLRDLIKRQKETGLTITAFCSNEGIPKSTFYYWRKKLGKEQINRFIPLIVNSSPAPMEVGRNSFIQRQDEKFSSGDDFLMELVYPNGTRLRIKNDPDLDHIRSLVCLLV